MGDYTISKFSTPEGDMLHLKDANAQASLATKAPLDSPALTGTPTAPTAASGTDTTQIATTAFVQEAVSAGIAASDAMVFKGTVGTGGTVTTLPTSGVHTGDTYRVITAGTYAGQICEVGDLIIATSGTPEWTVAQTNIDGAITSITGNTPVSVTGTGSSRTISVPEASSSTPGLMSIAEHDKLAGIAAGATANAGTVTSVRVQATSPVTSSTSTAQTSTLNTTIALANGYGDTKNPYGTKTKNYVLAGPTSGSAAAPTFRALEASDIPDLSGTYLTAATAPVTSVNTKTGAVVLTTSDLVNDSGYITSSDIPPGAAASTTTPKMDGTATIGTELAFARGDHIHPSDTSRVPTTRKINTKELSSDITLYGSDIAVSSSDSTKINVALSNKVDAVSGKGLSTNDYTTDEKNKLAGIAAGAQVNQNAFSNIKVGSTTVAADAATDTVELIAGTDITLTPDATNDTVTIGFSNSSGYTTNTGTVTSVGVSNATNGGLSVSGSPVTTSGNITVGHSNVLTSAQTTEDVYPIAIDKNGHVSSYGSAVTINGKALSGAVNVEASDIYYGNTLVSDALEGLSNSINNLKPATWYGGCSTTASTAAKLVTCTGFALTTGAIIGVLFTTANTAATPTLNVNSTGAKSIYVGSSTPSATTNVLKWSANTMLYFMYDGTYFRYVTSIAAASVDQPRGANTWYGTSSTGATTTAKTSTIANYVLTKGALVTIGFTYGNSANAPTLNINSTGAKSIYYNRTVTSSSNLLLWDAGDRVTFVYDGTGYAFLTKSKHTNILYGSESPSGTAETGTVYLQTGASAYTFQPRVNLTRTTTPALPASITTTAQTMHSFTLPPGLYLITFQINHGGGYTAGTCRWDLKAGSNTITQVRSATGATSGLIQNGCGLVQCTDASTTISFTAAVSSGSMTTGELHYSYIKLF